MQMHDQITHILALHMGNLMTHAGCGKVTSTEPLLVPPFCIYSGKMDVKPSGRAAATEATQMSKDTPASR